MADFNGVILNNIRDAFGLTRKELANKLNISEQALWQYERGIISPSYEILNSLENIFMVDRAFFMIDDKFQINGVIENVVDVKNVAYRSSFKAKTKRIVREQAYLNLTHKILKAILVGINEPSEKLTGLRQDVVAMMLETSANIDQIGLYVRNQLNINTDNKNLIPTIERAGAYIVERGMADDVDAYSTWTNDEMPLIVLGSTKRVAVRRNFDVAHELGHLLMHYQWDLSESGSTEYNLAEKMANDFAASLLLPKDTFPTVFGRLVKEPTDPESYKEIKLYYNVSMQAIAYRASRLGLISKQDAGYFWGKIRKRKWNVIEPFDKEIRLTSPGKIRALLTLRRDNQFSRITDVLAVKPEFLIVLGFDKMFIRSLKLENKRQYSDNVLNMFDDNRRFDI